MADKKDPYSGSITQKADENRERISEVSNVSRTINQMQKKVNQEVKDAKVNVGDFERIEEVQNSMVKVLNQLSSTVGSVGQGFAKIATDTAKASSDAVKQYGQAISQDINYNKQNIVATALSHSSPIFGYFAAKFVETDVFKSATERMKSNISSALSGVTSKFKEGFTNLFSGKKSSRSEIGTIKKPPKEKVPKMASGGYVEKAGMAYVHPAEVVMPIEKVLGRIDDVIESAREREKFAAGVQLASLSKINTYVDDLSKKQQIGIFKGFIRAYREVHTKYLQPPEKRMLRAVLSIQDTLGATIGTWQQVWQKMLVEHPFFRQMMFTFKTLGNIGSLLTWKPLYAIFRTRGGYASYLSRTGKPFEDINRNIGLIYTGTMSRLDSIAIYTKASAKATRDLSSFITGIKYEKLAEVGEGKWSIAGSIFGVGRKLLGLAGRGTAGALGLIFGKDVAKRLNSTLFTLESVNQKLLESGLLGRHNAEIASIYGGDKGTMGSKSFMEQMREYLDGQQKEQKKEEKYKKIDLKNQKGMISSLLGMKKNTKGTYELTKKINQRGRLQSVLGMLKSGGGLFKGVLSSALGFLPMLFGGGGGIGKGLASMLGNVLKSPLILTGLTTLLGGALAWFVGTKIGKWLDSKFGITKGIQGALNAGDAAARAKAGTQTKIMMAKAFTAREEGDLAGYKSRTTTKLNAQFGRFTKQRQESVGFLGRRALVGIQNGQTDYLMENIDKYMQYDPTEIALLREKWLNEGRMRGLAIGENPEDYGREREKSFLTYVWRHGKKLTPAQIDSLYKEYDKSFTMAHPLRDPAKYAEYKKQMVQDRLGEYSTKAGAYLDASQQKLAGMYDTAKEEALRRYKGSGAERHVRDLSYFASGQYDKIKGAITNSPAAQLAQAEAAWLGGKTSQAKKYIFDKTQGVWKDVSTLASEEVEQMLAQGSVIVGELQRQGKQAINTAMANTDQLKQAAAQSATFITTNVNNAAKVISSGAKETYNELSPMAKEVLRGHTFED